MTKLLLFDIDGTLCKPMQQIEQSTIDSLLQLKNNGWHIGVIGGSDRSKAMYQLGEDVIDKYMDYSFHENGTVYYQHGRLVVKEKLEDFIPEEQVSNLVKFLLQSIVDSNCPFMTGTFIERRSCMLNCSPCGRACTKEQRDIFFKWDKQTRCREKIKLGIKEKFPTLPLDVAIGGQISIDIYPIGLDKTRCLQYVVGNYSEIHFIGDKTSEGGNDYEIYNDDRVIGHSTKDPTQTEEIIHNLIFSK